MWNLRNLGLGSKTLVSVSLIHANTIVEIPILICGPE
jgi:hypothetical protein